MKLDLESTQLQSCKGYFENISVFSFFYLNPDVNRHLTDGLNVLGVNLHVGQVLAQKGELLLAVAAKNYLRQLVRLQSLVHWLCDHVRIN